MDSVGKNIHGEDIFFRSNTRFKGSGIYYVICNGYDLESLTIASDVTSVFCENNFLIDIKFPDTLTHLTCQNNNLKKLHIPKNLKELHCDNIELSGNIENCDITIEL
jgi:hypothetical protein